MSNKKNDVPKGVECPYCQKIIPAGVVSAMGGEEGQPATVEEWGVQLQYHDKDCHPFVRLGEELIPQDVWERAGRFAFASMYGESGMVHIPVKVVEAIPQYNPKTYLGAIYLRVSPLFGDGTFVVLADDVNDLPNNAEVATIVNGGSLSPLLAQALSAVRALESIILREVEGREINDGT